MTEQHLPPLSKAEKELVRQTHLPWSVVVEQSPLFGPAHPDDPLDESRYSNYLCKDLLETGIFQSVKTNEEPTSSTTFIARIEQDVGHESGDLLIICAMTMGVLPVPISEEQGFNFSLWRPGFPERKVIIDMRFLTYGVGGWIAIPIGLLPGWRLFPFPRVEHRFYDHLALAILKKKGELEALPADCSSPDAAKKK